MPGDTIYILNQQGPSPVKTTVVHRVVIDAGGDTLELPDSFFGSAGYENYQAMQQMRMRDPESAKENGQSGLFGFLFLVIAVVVLFEISKRKDPFGLVRRQKRKLAEKTVDIKGIQYHDWLCKYNPYYHSLSADHKAVFLQRVADFIQSKEFRFHSMVEEEYIPVLVSGAAIQMTFGLPNYQMDYFPVIHIIRKEYVLNIDQETYYGHVSKSGIYISWSSFLEGYSDYADSVNVGLHEMAHAVSYDLFLGEQDRHDEAFKERLKGFSKQGTAVFRAMQQGADHILDEYALTNFDEFWAVCVETFFENPVEFQRDLPDLYQSVCYLLNQNPLKPEKIIDRGLAGLAI